MPTITAIATEALRRALAEANPPPAIIFVDGEEFIRCSDGDDALSLFRETVTREGGEVALVEYRPRYGAYLKTREVFTARR